MVPVLRLIYNVKIYVSDYQRILSLNTPKIMSYLISIPHIHVVFLVFHINEFVLSSCYPNQRSGVIKKLFVFYSPTLPGLLVLPV